MKEKLSIEAIITEFKRYLTWETQSFEGWEDVEIFIADTLSEAWLLARPYDKDKFLNEEFKRTVDRANGKWLEKTCPEDSYKIILSTRYHSSLKPLVKTLVHEMRHCLDYGNEVKNLSFGEYRPGTRYYNDWSEFRATYAHTRYEFFARYSPDMTSGDIFDALSEILGKNSADATEGLMRSRDNIKDTLYFLSRYIGASRAIRNINMETINAPAFHLWTLTPQYIIENFGYVFYIGNEWDDTTVCDLDAAPETGFYLMLLKKLNEKTP